MAHPQTSRQIACLTLLVLATIALPAYSQEFAADVEMLSYDESGKSTAASDSRLNRLLQQPQPSDIFIVAHGWNNSFSDARSSYRNFMATMKSVATPHSLLPSTYRSLVIGVSWPSKAFDEDRQGAGRSADVDSADLFGIYRAFPRSKSGDRNYEADVRAIEELLAQESQAVSQEDYDELSSLMNHYRLGSDGAVSDDSAFFALGLSGRGIFDSGLSIRETLRYFSYWQMKERAGIVGQTGVRQLLDRVQTAFPKSRIHLFGHSFGCKLMLSCVGSNPEPQRKVDSLILLQGAVSYQAMSPIGGYSNVVSRVSGPIVATFSDNDSALAVPYELASRAAGQTAERRAVSKYSALGRVGPEFAESRTVVPAAKDDSYHFQHAVYGVYGSSFINGHSDFNNAAIGRMIWAAVYPNAATTNSPNSLGGRSIGEDESLRVAKLASNVVKQSPDDIAVESAITLYVDSIESSLRASRPRLPSLASDFQVGKKLDTFANIESISVEGVQRVRDRDILASKLVDPRFLQVKSYRESVRSWLVDERSGSSVGRILTTTGCSAPPDTTYKQCVGVCWRPKEPPGAGYRIFGSGVMVDWDMVLTAAHVVPDQLVAESPEFRDEVLKKYEFAASIGASAPPDEFGNVPPGTIIVPVTLRIEHPDFAADSGGRPSKSDLAILRLSRKVTAAELFGDPAIVELPYKLATENVWDDGDLKVVTLVGFGYCDRSATRGAGKRRAAENVLAAVPETEDEARIVGCDFGLEFAAGGQGIDTCNGDSGGPVFAKSNDGRLWCVGVTSRPSRVRLSGGIVVSGGGHPDTCGDGGVYVLVHKYPWISETLNSLRSP